MSTSIERMPKPRVWRALLHKELKESRPALLAGGVIFLGLPIIWTLVYLVIDPRHEVFSGMATVLWLLFAWLFAVVLAAQSIARDFGRKQGDFLLARPIRPAQVLLSKVLVGSLGLVGLALGVIIWESGLTLLDPLNFEHKFAFPWMCLGVSGVVLIAYFVALAATTLTRQTLSGVMLAALALVWVATIPLVSGDALLFLNLPQTYQWNWVSTAPDRWEVAGVRVLVVSLIAAVAVAGASLGVMLLAVRFEAVLRLGTRSVAWIVGLSLVLVCGLAITEVGASVPVTDVIWRADLQYWQDCTDSDSSRCYPHVRTGDHRFAVGRRNGLDLYEITDEGRIQHRRHVELASDSSGPLTRSPRAVFDEDNRLHAAYTTGVDRVPYQLPSGNVHLCRVDWDTGSIAAEWQLALPAEIDPRATVQLADAAIESPFLFVLYELDFPPEPGAHWGHREHLAADYRLRDSQEPELLRSFELGFDGIWIERPEFRLNANRRLQGMWGWTPPPRSEPDDSVLRCLLGSRGLFEIGGGFFAFCDRGGFTVLDYRPLMSLDLGPPPPYAGPPEAWGVTASPWAWLFRAWNPGLLAGGAGQIWEIHDANASCYDVADPTRPHKIAHINCFPIENAFSGPDYLLIQHYGGFSIVKHPE